MFPGSSPRFPPGVPAREGSYPLQKIGHASSVASGEIQAASPCVGAVRARARLWGCPGWRVPRRRNVIRAMGTTQNSVVTLPCASLATSTGSPYRARNRWLLAGQLEAMWACVVARSSLITTSCSAMLTGEEVRGRRRVGLVICLLLPGAPEMRTPIVTVLIVSPSPTGPPLVVWVSALVFLVHRTAHRWLPTGVRPSSASRTGVESPRTIERWGPESPNASSPIQGGRGPRKRGTHPFARGTSHHARLSSSASEPGAFYQSPVGFL